MISVRASIVAAALLSGGCAVAAEVEGVRLPDTVRLSEGGPELLLNGAGVRTRVFFRVYIGALYLQQKTGSASSAIADSGAKRIEMHVLRDITADQFYSSLNDGLKANHAPAELAKIEPQLKQLEAIFQAVKATRDGDVIRLDYVPSAGTRVTVNGENKGIVPGEEFNRSLLRVWLGSQPVDAALKKAMLGG